MKEFVPRRETAFLPRVLAFMLAAFMLIGFFPVNASALSHSITVHENQEGNIEARIGKLSFGKDDCEVAFSVSYRSDEVVHNADNYAVGAVLYGKSNGGWRQISCISSDLSGNDGYKYGYFDMIFPSTYDCSSYKLTVGMADLSTAGYGLAFTELYASKSYEFSKNGSYGGSSDTESDAGTIQLDIYQPYFWEGVNSITSFSSNGMNDFEISMSDYGIIFIPTGSGKGSISVKGSEGTIYTLSFNVSENVYSGAVVEYRRVSMNVGDTFSFGTDINSVIPYGMTEFKSSWNASNIYSLDYDPDSSVLNCENYSTQEYKAVGPGSTYYNRCYYSGSNETGYNVYVFRYLVEVSNEGVMTVTVSPSTLYLNTGDTYQLKLTKEFPEGADEATLNTSCSWRTNEPNVAVVSDSGVVTAVGKGTAKIFCTTEQGVSDSVYVYVDYEPFVHRYTSRLVDLEKGRSYNARIETYDETYGYEYYSYVDTLEEVNYAPSVASNSGGYIKALMNGTATVKYVCGFRTNNSSVYCAPGVITEIVHKEYIINVSEQKEDDDDDEFYYYETPTYIQPQISEGDITEDDYEIKINNHTDLKLAYFKVDTNKLNCSVKLKMDQTKDTSLRFSGLICDFAKKVGQKDYVYYPFNMDLFNADTNEEMSSLPEGAKITFYIVVPDEMFELRNRMRVFHINHNDVMEEVDSYITKKGGNVCVRFSMNEFSPVALYVDDLTEEQFEEISAAAGYVTSKDEVVYVDYVDSGAGLESVKLLTMDRTEQTVVCICAAVMLTAVIGVSFAAVSVRKKCRRKR
ncbi:MAG: Ig domain-containing protein [Huintestinicola sp.]|uniref:Ig-like domain-containing protein n=1 Tax=Huintestinicola sp. TaxID=2981661 RepID=UPI003F0A4746